MKYDEITIGQKESIIHIVTREDIQKFIELTGDNNIIHTVKNPIIHGLFGVLFISTIIGTKLPGNGAVWFKQSLTFLSPIRIGDIITIIAEVVNKNDKFKHIELSTNIYNQDNEIVTSGIVWVKIIEHG